MTEEVKERLERLFTILANDGAESAFSTYLTYYEEKMLGNLKPVNLQNNTTAELLYNATIKVFENTVVKIFDIPDGAHTGGMIIYKNDNFYCGSSIIEPVGIGFFYWERMDEGAFSIVDNRTFKTFSIKMRTLMS